MRLIVETPYGKIVSIEDKNISIEKIQSIATALSTGLIGYLKIQTKNGPVILLSECAKQSMIRIMQ